MVANTKDCDCCVHAGLGAAAGLIKFEMRFLGQNFEMEF